YASGGITDTEQQNIKKHVEKWMNRAKRTEPIEPNKLIPEINSLYRSFGLKEPRIVIASSPLVMAIAGSFAAALWYARKNNTANADSNRLAFDAMVSNEIYEASVRSEERR